MFRKIVILIVVQILFQFAICEDEIPWPPKKNYIIQKLDHFNFGPNKPSYIKNFKQKYLYENKWYKPGGPIFFYCGNEGPIEGFWNNTGLMFEIAPKFNALVIFGEHRYYGTSLPFGSKSFQQPYISLLSIEQAMADYVFMLEDVKKTFKLINSTKVIAFGGSYGGMLAGYMRMKYPGSIRGAIAASAPIRWVAGIGQFQQFFDTITRDYYWVNKQCPLIVKKAFKILQDSGKAGQFAEISKELRLCDPIKSLSDLDYVMKWLRNGFVMLSMMDYPYAASFMGSLPANPVNVSCKQLLKYQKQPVVALLEAAAVFYSNNNKKCYDPKKLYLECADITGCGLGPASKAWDFQACTEMDLYDRGANSQYSMFPSMPYNLTTVSKYCQTTWQVSRPTDQLRFLQWGGGDLSAASNIVFSNGDLDPWGLGGVTQSDKLPKSSIMLTVHGGAHHLDMRSSNKADPPSVKLVRDTEQKYIMSWLKQ